MLRLGHGHDALPDGVADSSSCLVHETRGRETNKIIDFFERQAVPDKEQISDSSSELVQQWRSNADILATELGAFLKRAHASSPMPMNANCLCHIKGVPYQARWQCFAQ